MVLRDSPSLCQQCLCPQCQQAMIMVDENSVKCEQCHHSYPLVAYCPKCQQPLQKLQACGATNYWCQHGHGLVSKQQVVWGM